MTVRTNNHPRDLLSVADLTAKEAADFDYIEKEDRYSPRLFRYHGSIYDACEFRHTTPIAEFKGWQGYQSDSFFSGILFRFVDDYERVIAATYF